jgi:hypothetical protein
MTAYGVITSQAVAGWPQQTARLAHTFATYRQRWQLGAVTDIIGSSAHRSKQFCDTLEKYRVVLAQRRMVSIKFNFTKVFLGSKIYLTNFMPDQNP